MYLQKTILLIGLAIASLGFHAQAQESILNSLAKGCQTELETYCASVTPGNKRLLACIYAHQDKLSGQCEFALYDASVQLERAVAALTYAASECSSDLQKFCSGVAQGEGRLVSCLNDNEAEVTARCVQAMKDVGLK